MSDCGKNCQNKCKSQDNCFSNQGYTCEECCCDEPKKECTCDLLIVMNRGCLCGAVKKKKKP